MHSILTQGAGVISSVDLISANLHRIKHMKTRPERPRNLETRTRWSAWRASLQRPSKQREQRSACCGQNPVVPTAKHVTEASNFEGESISNLVERSNTRCRNIWQPARRLSTAVKTQCGSNTSSKKSINYDAHKGLPSVFTAIRRTQFYVYPFHKSRIGNIVEG